VVRFQTGNIPTGIVVRGNQAFVNNEVNQSVSILDLKAKKVVTRDIPSSTPPEPGSFDHDRLMGKLVFFTALGVPDNGLRGVPIRDIIPLKFRGKQSDAAWSTCASCHFEGLADHVTWFFGDGPRNTIPLDSTYSKVNGAHDIRINNWSAPRDGVTEFNNNSRNVQCGSGFAGGDAPQNVAGVDLPCPGAGPGLTMTANQPVSYQDAKVDPGTLKFLEIIGTFDPSNPIEIRGQGAAIGQTPLGVLGFNAPSLLSVNYHAPYFHNGAARTLEEVFTLHQLGGGTIADTLNDTEEAALLSFLNAIDGRTATFESEGDIFKDPTRNLP
jgi:hypothetical protein